jgi:hypothetical protein
MASVCSGRLQTQVRADLLDHRPLNCVPAIHGRRLDLLDRSTACAAQMQSAL